MDQLAALRIFCRVAARRHFATAAKDLKTSQATVTRAVQSLEREFQTELVRRSTRELVLTDAGNRLYRRAAVLLESMADLHEEVVGGGSEPFGSLRITAPTAFGVTVLAAIAARFCSSFPRVSIDIVLTDRFLDLIAENVDLAVRIGVQPDSRLIRRKLGSLTEVLVASPEYLARAGAPEVPAGLSSCSFVALSVLRNNREGLELVGPQGEKSSARPEAALAFDTPLAVREALLAGAGVGRIHFYLVAADLERGRLVHVLPRWTCPRWELALVSTARERSRASDAFEAVLVGDLNGVAGIEVATG